MLGRGTFLLLCPKALGRLPTAEIRISKSKTHLTSLPGKVWADDILPQLTGGDPDHIAEVDELDVELVLLGAGLGDDAPVEQAVPVEPRRAALPDVPRDGALVRTRHGLVEELVALLVHVGDRT